LISWAFYSDEPNFAFHHWDFGGKTADEYRWVCQSFEDEGHDVYIADFDQLGFYACRAVVPGLSEVYPIEDLEWDNNNRAATWRPVLLNLHTVDNDELQGLYDWLVDASVDDRLSVATLAGVAPDPGSPWDALRVGHLRLWLAFALGQTESIPTLCQWAIEAGEASNTDVRLYRCLASLHGLQQLGGNTARFDVAVAALYPAETLRLARSILDASVRFPGLHDPGMALTDMTTHRSLIAASAKLKAAMDEQPTTHT